MKKRVIIITAIAMIVLTIGIFPITVAADYPSSWATEQVRLAIKANLVPTCLQSNYSQPTTRAEFAALGVAFYEMITGRLITERATFNDTRDLNVQKIGGLGVVDGVGGGYFNPNGTLTREQAAVILVRLAYTIGQPFPLSAPTFSDNSRISTWAVDSVGQIQMSGIMSGTSNDVFSPSGSFTREQSIVTIFRMFELLQVREWEKDGEAIPSPPCLVGHYRGEDVALAISPEQLIGVWQMAEFDDYYLGIYISCLFEIYFTYDNNAIIRRSCLNPGGIVIATIHFIYEITRDGLELTFVSQSPHHWHDEDIEIWLEGDGLYLNVYHSWRDYNELHFLQRISDEVPFGFTNADKHEIQNRIDQIMLEIRNHAKRFANALDLPIIETEWPLFGNVPRYSGLGFQIDGIDFTIALDFTNWLERWPDGGGVRVRVQGGVSSVPLLNYPGVTGGGFSLYHSPISDIPEEWLEVFITLDDNF